MSADVADSLGTAPEAELLRYASPRGRWALAAVILGSGAAFLESSVVTVALPAIGRDLDLELGGLQWVMNAYLLSLSALMITGGSLGDLYGRRRVFNSGLIGFAAAALPAAAGLSASTAVGSGAFSDGFHTAMLIAAAIAALGGLISWLTIRGPAARLR